MMLFALLLLAAQSDAAVAIRVTGPVDDCRAVLGERTFDPRVDSADRDAALATIPAGATVRVTADEDAPYRCIGGVIYDLQQRGHRKIDFVAPQTPPRR